MNDWLPRQGHSLLQAGIFLFLLALLVGLAVPLFAVPRLGLSTHLLGLMQGLFLLILGILWPRLKLSRGMGQLGVVLALYGCFAAWASNFSAAALGAGNSIVPIAAGSAHGTPTQELLITMGLRSAGLALILTTLVVLWGLRSGPNKS